MKEGVVCKKRKLNSVWIYCPYCGRKTRSKLLSQFILRYCPVYCPKCRREIVIHAKQLKIEVCDEVQ